MRRDSPGVAASDDAPAVPEGLRWVSDREPGIRRVRRGRGFGYLDASGRRVTDAATLQRISTLAIPPAYDAVWICARASGHLQATGRDARGRKQYRYHPQWQAERGEGKFANLLEFGHVLPRIRRCVARDLGAAHDAATAQRRVLAALVRLLDTTFVRIGNDAYARDNGSFGLTTLRNRHAGVRGSEVKLRFRGKGGQPHEVRLDDRRVAAIVKRCQELPGQELFAWEDDDGSVRRVDSADVNAYLADCAGSRITAKDFRTWHGSVLALQLALAPQASKTSVLAGVSAALGNTPAVCRKSYVHPAVLDGMEAGFAAGVAGTAARGRGLRRAEQQLMRLLRPAARRRRSGTAAERA